MTLFQNYYVINYCDDFLGFGTPSTGKRSLDALYDINWDSVLAGKS